MIMVMMATTGCRLLKEEEKDIKMVFSLSGWMSSALSVLSLHLLACCVLRFFCSFQ